MIQWLDFTLGAISGFSVSLLIIGAQRRKLKQLHTRLRTRRVADELAVRRQMKVS